MKYRRFMKSTLLTVCLLLLATPVLLSAQPPQAQQNSPPSSPPPPIEQPLVREGAFAVKLLSALGLGTTDNEIEAENKLGEAGIAPRNGWIADYPVTPDILGELQSSVSSAADSGKIAMNKDEALNRLKDAAANTGLSVRSAYGQGPATPSKPEDYTSTTVINNYYYEQGPPVVTYYPPPPTYVYLYSWVPYPFWWTGFWFSGFFILHDFHRVVHDHRRPVIITNHFNDIREHRVFRIDPAKRFKGRTFAGIGAQGPRRSFISPGVPRAHERIFNAPHIAAPPQGVQGMPRGGIAPRGGGTPRGGGGGPSRGEHMR